MSRASGAGFSGASAPVLPDNNGGDVEDNRCLPPRMVGDHLTISYPLIIPMMCIVGNCRIGIKGNTWTAVVNNFTRHLRDVHKVPTKRKTHWCALCRYEMGRQVANHACFNDDKNPLLIYSKIPLKYKCDQCTESYPTWRGLSGHKQHHKKEDI